jgi:hypothetical protein
VHVEGLLEELGGFFGVFDDDGDVAELGHGGSFRLLGHDAAKGKSPQSKLAARSKAKAARTCGPWFETRSFAALLTMRPDVWFRHTHTASS